MADVKVKVTKHLIPEHLKNKNYLKDEKYRKECKEWFELIWAQKDTEIENLKF